MKAVNEKEKILNEKVKNFFQMNQPKTIFYRFKSEKRKYSFTFEEPDACISDIKRFIIKSRNLEKFPENFELIFIDEKTNYQIDDDLVKSTYCKKKICFDIQILLKPDMLGQIVYLVLINDVILNLFFKIKGFSKGLSTFLY